MGDLSLGVERWVNDGGHVGAEAVIRREATAGHHALGGPLGRRGQVARPSEVSSSPAAGSGSISRPRKERPRSRVLIAGGGVAGLETLLALHALAGDRVELTLLAPELKFVNHSMSVHQPFAPQ